MEIEFQRVGKKYESGHDALSLTTQQEFREALIKERRIELAFESKRYFDLNRWGILRDKIQFQMDIKGELTFPSNRLIQHPITGKSYFLYPQKCTC